MSLAMQPSNPPVTLYVFDSEDVMIVLSCIPGREAREICLFSS